MKKNSRQTRALMTSAGMAPEQIQPDPSQRWWKIQNAATTDDSEESTEVLIYGDIGASWWGESVIASEFRREFSAITTPRIDVHINSLGGSVYEGLAIMNTIRQHKSKVVVTVDGIAASAASYIAMAGDEVVMGVGAELMIHDAWMIAIGDPTDLADAAASLDKTCDSIAAIYADKAGGTPGDWRAAMKAETWYSAEEAISAGLADRIDAGAVDRTEGAKAGLDLSRFAYAGRAAAPPPSLPHKAGAPSLPVTTEPEESTTTQGESMEHDELVAAIRDRLGIPADSVLDDDGLVAALDEGLAERADQTGTTTNPPALPEGVVLVDQGVFDQMRADAAAGRDARTQQITERREALVDAAIEDGRIPSARRDHWLTQLAADEEGASTVLASLAKNTIPVEARGHSGGNEDDLYDLYFPKEA